MMIIRFCIIMLTCCLVHAGYAMHNARQLGKILPSWAAQNGKPFQFSMRRLSTAKDELNGSEKSLKQTVAALTEELEQEKAKTAEISKKWLYTKGALLAVRNEHERSEEQYLNTLGLLTGELEATKEEAAQATDRLFNTRVALGLSLAYLGYTHITE